MEILPYAVTDIPALLQNARILNGLAGEFYCVVKCDAYGHGGTECVEALYKAGMRRFAVSDMREAVNIKPYAPRGEIIILGATDYEAFRLAEENSLILTLHSAEQSRRLLESSCRPELHIKLDTGMHRSGFECDPKMILDAIGELKYHISGVYTHFPRADSPDISETEEQLRLFNTTADALERVFGRRLTRHTAASPAFFRLPAGRRGLCRIGLALYGVIPGTLAADIGLTPVMSFYSAVTSVHNVRKGEYIGYGTAFRCGSDRIIATVAGGYANGILRCLKNTPCAVINGYRVSMAGTPCMDRCMFDVTPIFEKGDKVRVFDRVVFFDSEQSVESFARALSTISYEALTTVGNLNRRLLIQGTF